MNAYDDYGKAGFGDKRLGDRLVRSLNQLAGNPSASISAACRDPHQAKAIYRFVGNDEVTVDAVTKNAREVTIKNIHAAKPPVVLCVQDTTELNYSNLKRTDGLGSISGRKTASGMELHSALAVGEAGEVFGLLAQKLWVRPHEDFGQSTPEKCKKVPIEDKESYKWLETMDSVGSDFPEGTRAVHVCDREGDIYEFFCKAARDGALYLCRKSFDRKIEEEDGVKKLAALIGSLPETGRITVRVPRDSHTNRIARDAEVAIKHGKCRITKPAPLKKYGELPESIEIYFVAAEEIGPPQGQEKLLWHLVTNVPTGSFEDAVERIQWYTHRWKIEIFHRTLKDGCKVEELQSESGEKLMKLVAIYSIIALNIMHLTYIARAHPDEGCEICLTEDEWKILYRVANKTKALPENPPTIQEAVIMIAKLGGFLARKSDGFPGVTVIWRGLTSFYTILEAVPYL
jgi:hypothetical protein